jgi:pyruvate-formate lyase-activating enzyme
MNKTKTRTITKRGVLWLGQTCNLKCFFCYFIDKIADKEHPEHPFMSLEKAKKICHTLRTVYGNTSIDIQGGEPTIYPDIFELTSYCAQIGLAPTLITNAIVLANEEMCQKFKDASVKDFLVSIHGFGDTYDKVVGLENGSKKQMRAIENLRKLDIPFRLNCTMTKDVVNELEDVADFAVKCGALAVNFIAFNPFADQQSANGRSADNVPMYGEIKKHLTVAIDTLENADIETNVRYLPMCMAEARHLKNFYNFQQLSYDSHEWDFNSWTWTTRFNQRSNSPELDKPIPILLYGLASYNGIEFGDTAVHGTKPHYMREIDVEEHLLKLFSANVPKDILYRQNARLRAEKHCKYAYNETCQKCSLRLICDGFHSDYAEVFGASEAQAFDMDMVVDDPKNFINEQEKIEY